MPVDLDRDRFEALVGDALDLIPDELASLVTNTVVLVEDQPPADGPQNLLGLYVGHMITDRNDMWGGAMPDRITIFRGPLQAICSTEEELVHQVRVTVVHEVAHHFGLDDDRLRELGYG